MFWKLTSRGDESEYRFVHAPEKVAEGFFLFVEPILNVAAPPRFPDLHPATLDLVDRFANALAQKLRDAERKYGWEDQWANIDWRERCQTQLLLHIYKGDPLDVAAYAAFCWHHDWPTRDTHLPPEVETPDQYPFTCGTDHVRAQAALTLVEGLISTANACDAATIEALDNLVGDAGLSFAAELIKRGRAVDVPF